MGLNGPTVVYALHKWVISIFSKTTEDTNPQIYTILILEGIYILTGNDVINYFWSAANCLNVFIWGHVQAAISP